jgi:hypothetical protein
MDYRTFDKYIYWELSWFLMINRVEKTWTVLVLVLLALPLSAVAAAPISTINPGNTVFLGEEGLDITAAMGTDTRIGWWASAANIETTSPSKTIDVAARMSSFMVTPSDFGGYTGNWYRLKSDGKTPDGLAFTVADPSIDMRVYDETLGVDATANGWITTGSEVSFRITTNLYQITQRTGVSSVPIKIHVQSPDGASYSSLINAAGSTTSIMDVPLSSSPYSTGPIWDTGRRETYPYGSYNVWAECNVNSMKDNYGESGKTYTPGSGLLDQEVNPIIDVNTRTASPTTAATRVPTTVKTMAPTTEPTPEPTTVTTETTVLTTAPTALPTTEMSQPVQTKSPGFESVLAGSALLLALAWSVRKE